MKIDLDKLDLTQFMAHQHMVAGEVVTLVQPQHIGTKWTQDNKHLRSSVWNGEGELISAGLPKFTNWGENPDNFPVPSSLKNCTVMEKLDGSLLIVTKYKNQYILRTRGTVDASTMANGDELEIFKNTILKKLENLPVDLNNSWKYSILFEWLSPRNVIVLRYSDAPEWQLVGAINHSDYSLFTQLELDEDAEHFGLKRPEKFTFTDITDMLQNVDKWQDKEGVCLYSKNGQTIHKIKAAKYLLLHHLKSELSSTEKVLDVWLEQGMPDYNTFYNYIVTTFDFELAEQAKGTISRIVDARKDVDQIVSGMTEFVDTKVRKLTARKDQAQLVLGAYGNTNRASFVFALLDGKTLTKDQLKKLMFQVIKN